MNRLFRFGVFAALAVFVSIPVLALELPDITTAVRNLDGPVAVLPLLVESGADKTFSADVQSEIFRTVKESGTAPRTIDEMSAIIAESGIARSMASYRKSTGLLAEKGAVTYLLIAELNDYQVVEATEVASLNWMMVRSDGAIVAQKSMVVKQKAARASGVVYSSGIKSGASPDSLGGVWGFGLGYGWMYYDQEYYNFSGESELSEGLAVGVRHFSRTDNWFLLPWELSFQYSPFESRSDCYFGQFSLVPQLRIPVMEGLPVSIAPYFGIGCGVVAAYVDEMFYYGVAASFVLGVSAEVWDDVNLFVEMQAFPTSFQYLFHYSDTPGILTRSGDIDTIEAEGYRLNIGVELKTY